jgi:DNA invertase Pin-like site-specific DNA recombinase
MTATRIGYRIITGCGHDDEVQLAALRRAGCRQLFTDYGLVAEGGPRPMLARALEALHRGDELVVVHRDQLGPKAGKLAADLAGQGISLNVLSEAPHLARILAG